MLQIRNVTIVSRKDDRLLADDLSFTLHKGERAALIGEEGNGKSTLLKFILDPGLVEPYCLCSGRATASGKLGYLPQSMDPALADVTLAAYFDGAAYYEHFPLLEQLGVNEELLFSPRKLGTLSGGEKVRVQLCRMLLDEPDILLLDEPTNDLDIPTLEWLERFLLSARQPVLFISHDETLIENTANVIIHMEQLLHKTQTRITLTRAPYREYLERRGRDFRHQNQMAFKERADHEKQMRRWQQIYDRVDHEQRSLSRQDPHSGRLLKKKMHSVQSTGRRLEKQAEDFTEFPETEEAILTFFDPEVRLPRGKTVLDWSLPELRAGEKHLASGLQLRVSGPARVGITGANGAGKTTLLRALWEELRQRQDVRAAWMPQDYAVVLDYAQTPLEHLEAVYSREALTRARSCLGSMRFTHEEMTGRIGALSGGQKAKLLLLDMVLQKANVLLLDEPTRNFSPLSAPVVRKALREFGGAILSVSHDRKYLAEVCTEIYELRPEGLLPVRLPY